MGTIRSQIQFFFSVQGHNNEGDPNPQNPPKQSQSQMLTMHKKTFSCPPLLESPWRSVEWGNKENILEKLVHFHLGNSKVDTLRILIQGPVGAGKSSFFNSVDAALQGRIGTRALADTVNRESFTLKPTTYKLRREETTLPITLIDTRGVESEGQNGMKVDDITEILQGHIKNEPEKPKNENKKILTGKIHCLVSVLPASHISLIKDDVISQMREVRLKARDFGIPQAIIVTKVDETCPHVKADIKNVYKSEKIQQKMEECSQKLGVPMCYIYPVKNYHNEDTTNTEMDSLILHAMLNIVKFAKDYVIDQEDNE